MDGRLCRQFRQNAMEHGVADATRKKRTSDCLWMHQVLSIRVVEIGGTLASELEMLLLVMAYGDMCCPGGLRLAV